MLIALQFVPSQNIALKIIIISLLFFFIWPTIAWALDSQNLNLGWARVYFNQQPIEVSKKIGEIKEIFQAKQGEQIIIYIEDLHCNYEVQQNIAKIIKMLTKKHKINLIGIEGASQTLNLTKLSTFPIAKVKKAVSNYFMQQGKISGPEYYAIASEKPATLEGIETQALYNTSQTLLTTFLNNETQGLIYDLQLELDKLKIIIYNSALLDYDQQQMAYTLRKISLLEYSVFLYTTSKQLGIALTNYPNLKLYVSARQTIIPPAIKPDFFFREIKELDSMIREKLYTTALQRELDTYCQRLVTIENMLNISATPEDLSNFIASPDSFSMKNLLLFIRKHNQNFSSKPELLLLDSHISACQKFYALADKRSSHFVNNLSTKMRFNQQDISILVAGGFHTSEILNEFKKQNITYVAIQPKLTKPDIINPYFALLQNQSTALEHYLSQEQKLLQIPRPFWQGVSNIIPTRNLLSKRIRIFYAEIELMLKTTYLAWLLAKHGHINMFNLWQEFNTYMQSYQADDKVITVKKQLLNSNSRVSLLGLEFLNNSEPITLAISPKKLPLVKNKLAVLSTFKIINKHITILATDPQTAQKEIIPNNTLIPPTLNGVEFLSLLGGIGFIIKMSFKTLFTFKKMLLAFNKLPRWFQDHYINIIKQPLIMGTLLGKESHELLNHLITKATTSNSPTDKIDPQSRLINLLEKETENSTNITIPKSITRYYQQAIRKFPQYTSQLELFGPKPVTDEIKPETSQIFNSPIKILPRDNPELKPELEALGIFVLVEKDKPVIYITSSLYQNMNKPELAAIIFYLLLKKSNIVEDESKKILEQTTNYNYEYLLACSGLYQTLTSKPEFKYRFANRSVESEIINFVKKNYLKLLAFTVLSILIAASFIYPPFLPQGIVYLAIVIAGIFGFLLTRKLPILRFTNPDHSLIKNLGVQKLGEAFAELMILHKKDFPDEKQEYIYVNIDITLELLELFSTFITKKSVFPLLNTFWEQNLDNIKKVKRFSVLENFLISALRDYYDNHNIYFYAKLFNNIDKNSLLKEIEGLKTIITKKGPQLLRIKIKNPNYSDNNHSDSLTKKRPSSGTLLSFIAYLSWGWYSLRNHVKINLFFFIQKVKSINLAKYSPQRYLAIREITADYFKKLNQEFPELTKSFSDISSDNILDYFPLKILANANHAMQNIGPFHIKRTTFLTKEHFTQIKDNNLIGLILLHEIIEYLLANNNAANLSIHDQTTKILEKVTGYKHEKILALTRLKLGENFTSQPNYSLTSLWWHFNKHQVLKTSLSNSIILGKEIQQLLTRILRFKTAREPLSTSSTFLEFNKIVFLNTLSRPSVITLINFCIQPASQIKKISLYSINWFLVKLRHILLKPHQIITPKQKLIPKTLPEPGQRFSAGNFKWYHGFRITHLIVIITTFLKLLLAWVPLAIISRSFKPWLNDERKLQNAGLFMDTLEQHQIKPQKINDYLLPDRCEIFLQQPNNIKPTSKMWLFLNKQQNNLAREIIAWQQLNLANQIRVKLSPESCLYKHFNNTASQIYQNYLAILCKPTQKQYTLFSDSLLTEITNHQKKNNNIISELHFLSEIYRVLPSIKIGSYKYLNKLEYFNLPAFFLRRPLSLASLFRLSENNITFTDNKLKSRLNRSYRKAVVNSA